MCLTHFADLADNLPARKSYLAARILTETDA